MNFAEATVVREGRAQFEEGQHGRQLCQVVVQAGGYVRQTQQHARGELAVGESKRDTRQANHHHDIAGAMARVRW